MTVVRGFQDCNVQPGKAQDSWGLVAIEHLCTRNPEKKILKPNVLYGILKEFPGRPRKKLMSCKPTCEPLDFAGNPVIFVGILPSLVESWDIGVNYCAIIEETWIEKMVSRKCV